jgi:endonuclease/exonuclease/phosphatase family metal-dependent hydrolase
MAPQLIQIPTWAFRSGRWEKQEGDEPVVARAASLTLLTWNVWFGRHRFRERTEALLDEISWRSPDVIALQEVTAGLLEALVAHPQVRASYHLTDVSGATFERYGVLLLSKIPFLGAGLVGLPSQMGRRLLVGQLANGLGVATVHLESTAACAAERVAQLKIIQPLLAASTEDVVLMGDMNFAPEAEAESAALDPSFVDAWSKNLFADPGYSVDSSRNEMRRRYDESHTQKRIDRVFVRSASWQIDGVSLTGTAPIDLEGTFVSDHFGLEAVLSAKQK